MDLLPTGRQPTPRQAEQRRDRLATAIRWAVVAGVGTLLAPLAFTLLQATLALIAAAMLAMAAVAFAPVLAMALANRKMAAILDEARRNPIPTLECELLSRRQHLHALGEHLRSSLAHVESFRCEAEDAARRYPNIAARWRERAAKALALADSQKRSFVRTVRTVDDFEQEVERCRTEWKLVLAEAAMNATLALGLDEPLAQLRSRTAIDAITHRMNEAFAGLELELLKERAEARPHIDADPAVRLGPAARH